MVRQLNDLPLSELEEIDAVCDRFEAAFKAGVSPRIEDFVARKSGAERSELVAALLAVELDLRRRQGERPTPEVYCVRFPDQAGSIARLFEQTQRSVESLPMAAQETLRSGPAAGASGTPPAKQIGRFEVISILGEGAFGTVYRA